MALSLKIAILKGSNTVINLEILAMSKKRKKEEDWFKGNQQPTYLSFF